MDLRAEGDLRNEKINYKVREHSLAKVPALLVVGRKEAADRTVSIRRLGKDGQSVLALDAVLRSLIEEAVPPDMRMMKQAALPALRRPLTDFNNSERAGLAAAIARRCDGYSPTATAADPVEPAA